MELHVVSALLGNMSLRVINGLLRSFCIHECSIRSPFIDLCTELTEIVATTMAFLNTSKTFIGHQQGHDDVTKH